MRTVSRSHAAAGFTLIELLVVIAIIAVLISALLHPAVQHVRQVIERDTSAQLDPLKRSVLDHASAIVAAIKKTQDELARGTRVGRATVRELFELACDNERAAVALQAASASPLPDETNEERTTRGELAAFVEVSEEAAKKTRQVLGLLLDRDAPPVCATR